MNPKTLPELKEEQRRQERIAATGSSYRPSFTDFFPRLGRGHRSRKCECRGQDPSHAGGNLKSWREERGLKE